MKNHRVTPRLRAGIPRVAVVCGICFAGADVFAQEAISESTQVDRGRQARKQAIDRNLYNLKAGPVLARFDGQMGFELNDNPQLQDNNTEVDFAFHPEANMSALWALNPRNALALNLGVGYVKYVRNTDLDHLVIAPSSELALDIYTGDFAINLHERVSHTQDAASDPTVSATGDFSGIENTAGTRVDWDLNQLTSFIGYDHYNFIATSTGVSDTLQPGTPAGSRFNDVQDRASDLFYGRVGMKVSPAVTTGVEAGGGFTDYESDFFNDNSQFSVGPFVEAQVTRDLRARAAGGYVRSDFEATGAIAAPSAVNDYYAELSFNHQLSQYMSHQLALGREAKSGAESELVTLWYARYKNNWDLSRFLTLHTDLFYERGRERSGVGERLWRVGLGFGATVPLSRKLSVSGGYQFLYKDSDQVNRDYLQNLVSLQFRYAF